MCAFVYVVKQYIRVKTHIKEWKIADSATHMQEVTVISLEHISSPLIMYSCVLVLMNEALMSGICMYTPHIL